MEDILSLETNYSEVINRSFQVFGILSFILISLLIFPYLKLI